MQYFYSSSDETSNYYKVMIRSSLENEEKISKKKLELISKSELLEGFKFNLLKKIIVTIFLITKIPFLGFAGVNYRGYRVGRYAVSFAFRNYNSYLRKISFYKAYVRSLIICCHIIDSTLPMCDKIQASYIEHGYYVNGVCYEIFSKHGIPIYHDHYPYNFVRCESKKMNGFEEYTKISRDKIECDSISRGKSLLLNVVKDTNSIPYMNVKFQDDDYEFFDCDYIIYCHSFTDAQLCDGYDGAFLNMAEWLMFTIKSLKGKRIIIKSHPNFYADDYDSEVVKWDRDIFRNFISGLDSHDNFLVIDYPLRNEEILERVNKNTILISHHGSALLEGGALGFKCICSSSTIWRDFGIFNEWSSRDNYKSLLKMDFDDLEDSNMDELYRFYDCLYSGDSSYFSENHFSSKIASSVGMSRKEIVRNPSVFELASDEQVNAVVDSVKNNIFQLSLA